MHGLSTILSLIFKLIGKIFRTFGINAILTIIFIIELVGCIGYISEMYNYDNDKRDYEITEIESVVELDREDPIFIEEDIFTSEYDHYYLARVKIYNRYSEELAIPSMSAETEKGDIVIARRITYYGNDMSGHGVYESIPEGTQAVVTYMLEIGDYRMEDTDAIKLYDFSGDDNESMLVPLPK